MYYSLLRNVCIAGWVKCNMRCLHAQRVHTSAIKYTLQKTQPNSQHFFFRIKADNLNSPDDEASVRSPYVHTRVRRRRRFQRRFPCRILAILANWPGHVQY